MNEKDILKEIKENILFIKKEIARLNKLNTFVLSYCLFGGCCVLAFFLYIVITGYIKAGG